MFDFISVSNDLFVTAFGIYFRFCLISFFALFGLFIAVKYSNEIDKILTRFKHIRSLRAHNIITFKYQFGLLVLSSLFFFLPSFVFLFSDAFRRSHSIITKIKQTNFSLFEWIRRHTSALQWMRYMLYAAADMC